MIIDLSDRPLKNVCHHWAMLHLDDPERSIPGVTGRSCVYGSAGESRTTRVVAVDPKSRRFLTVSGAVYELGAPDLAFAIKNPNLVRELGV